MELQYIRLSDLQMYDNNPRLNDDAVPAVAESIKEFGFKVPIVIDSNNVIIAGHTRYKASKLLGLEEVPCIVADDLTEEQVKAFRLVDNKVAEIAEWDFDKLEIELSSLDFDMKTFGFEDFDIENQPDIEEDNFEVELPEEPKAKLGNIYQLGKHRLMCGDSTSITDIEMLLNGSSIDLVVTDPPYNMNYEGAGNTKASKRKSNKIINDNMSDAAFNQFMQAIYNNIYAVLKEGASFYVFYKELGKGVFLTTLQQSGLTFKQELIWVKNQIVLGGNKYQNMYEPCLFGCKGKSIKNWYTGRKERSVIEHIDLMNEAELRDTVKELLESITTDVVRENKQVKNDLHPTMKPIKLLSKFLRNSSKADDNILDLFGGSGSTLIACEQMNRNCYMMEFDPKYIDVIIERWENFTGEKAVLLSGNDTTIKETTEREENNKAAV